MREDLTTLGSRLDLFLATGLACHMEVQAYALSPRGGKGVLSTCYEAPQASSKPRHTQRELLALRLVHHHTASRSYGFVTGLHPDVEAHCKCLV